MDLRRLRAGGGDASDRRRRRRRRSARLSLVVVAFASALTSASCTTPATAPPPHHRRTPAHSATAKPTFRRYVALGDSYTAGPLIPSTDLAGGCLRSDHNYPHLLARLLPVAKLVDVSCGGATTADLTDAQHIFGRSTAAPQLSAVNRGTDLVTVGIGGNDFGLFGSLLACARLPADRCSSPRREATAIAELPRIGSRVTRGLRAVHRHAPAATIVLVGYLRLVPDHGGCRELGLSRRGLVVAREVGRLLDLTLSAAAEAGQATYIDAYRLSAGHDVCAPRPWVNGRNTRTRHALAYHPLESGMQAIATAIAKRLR